MSSPSKRRDMDVMKLMMADYKVEMVNDSMSEFYVEFTGPAASLYEGGVWRVRVDLPEAYPYKSPSIGFVNRIYHPNIDEISGSVCLNVINQTWSPMFDLVNIFEVFLPQLLLYPNPSDPLNGEAASLMMRDSSSYEQRVKEHCARYAKPEDIQGPQEEEEEDDSESEDDKNYSSSEDEMEVISVAAKRETFEETSKINTNRSLYELNHQFTAPAMTEFRTACPQKVRPKRRLSL